MTAGDTGMKRQVKNVMAHVVARLLPAGLMRDRRYFELWQSKGFHVTANHFYEPVPDTTALPPSTFTRERIPAGIEMNDCGQIELLNDFQTRFRAEYEQFPQQRQADPQQFYIQNDAYGDVDAEILYCMVRSLQPRRIMEIGSGFSTLLTAQACRQNERDGAPVCSHQVIDPFPNPLLTIRSLPGLEIVEKPVQDIPVAAFQSLSAGDILFIDSSHVLKIGSDVQYEFLEILPSLKPGVHIHIHDVFLPEEYPEVWIRKNRWFWSEQYLLEAFLAFNRTFEITWAGRYMHVRYPDRLRSAFPSYARVTDNGARHWPASFWMQRVN